MGSRDKYKLLYLVSGESVSVELHTNNSGVGFVGFGYIVHASHKRRHRNDATSLSLFLGLCCSQQGRCECHVIYLAGNEEGINVRVMS